ncbi:scopoletin glucosyltransferase-like [Abrus precatorius]|uniref:Scopoletin glucosyltransferase-like n=1 Tax=Abrus precatorius TaxID=3816 RepID=A0A8B8M1N6_ABRPR|nr:scopoletin glucosyltransferase-like [Abrus precatorius]
MSFEIYILPFFGQGHIFPCVELCKRFASRNFNVTLIISSNIATFIPSFLHQHPLLRIAQIPSPPSQPPLHHEDLSQGLEKILSESTRPVCAIIDIMMNWSAHVFKKFQIPMVAFFTSGACSTAMELALWKVNPLELKPGETRLLPGFPQDMALTYSDLKQRPHHPPPPPTHHGGAGFPPPPSGAGQRRRGPPKHGDPPPWLEEVQETVALMINTCHDLEHPFITYIANDIGKPVWGVGPLLPEQYWKSAGSLLLDRDVQSNRQSSVTEEEVIQWLDSKPRGSVLYVSFGSEVGLSVEEYKELAQAMEELCEHVPFIWVLQPGSGRPSPGAEEGYFPHGLDSIVGNKGLIIRGWAPQLLILSHPSTGGFLSHCGWNSTMEAIGRGVPFLAWPIRGDQYHDAKLVVSHLKVGYKVTDDLSEKVTKDHIVMGIKKLMGDKEMKKMAGILSAKFQHGFHSSSVAALDDFKDYINQSFVWGSAPSAYV